MHWKSFSTSYKYFFNRFVVLKISFLSFFFENCSCHLSNSKRWETTTSKIFIILPANSFVGFCSSYFSNSARNFCLLVYYEFYSRRHTNYFSHFSENFEPFCISLVFIKMWIKNFWWIQEQSCWNPYRLKFHVEFEIGDELFKTNYFKNQDLLNIENFGANTEGNKLQKNHCKNIQEILTLKLNIVVE